MGLPIRLLIVDDHPMMRFGLVSLFQHESDFLVVAEACNGVEAIEKAIAQNPDVILLDLGLPQKSGLEVIQEVLQINPNLKIIVFTSYSDGDRILTAIKAGAIGYLVKDNSPQDIFYAVRNAYQGKPTLSTRTELSLFHEIQDKKPVPSSRDQLTTREIDILRFVALGMKYAEIAKEICVTEGTVRSHMSNLSKKLGFENRAQAVVYAIRNGLIDIEVEKL